MNVEIGTEAAQFPEKENINGIFVAVQDNRGVPNMSNCSTTYICILIGVCSGSRVSKCPPWIPPWCSVSLIVGSVADP
jgi:hypothetical protein